MENQGIQENPEKMSEVLNIIHNMALEIQGSEDNLSAKTREKLDIIQALSRYKFLEVLALPQKQIAQGYLK